MTGWHDLLLLYPSRRIETAAGVVSIREAGSGPAIVLLHGIGSGSGSWVYQLEHLSSRFRVIAWDAPGYGESDPLPVDAASADSYANSLLATLDAANVSSALVVGHSLGALIAARFVIRFPDRVRGLFLADPAIGHARFPESEKRAKREARLVPFKALGSERFAAERAPNLLAHDTTPEKIALVEWNMARLTRKGLGDAAQLLSAGDLLGDVAAISKPARVVCGEDDQVTPPAECRKVAAAFPELSTYHEISASGHASYIDQPDAFTHHVLQFAKECT